MIQFRTFALLCLSASFLGGCEMNSPTWVSQDRVEVHANQFTDTFETAKLDDGMIRAIAVNYYRYGNGTMNLVVGYDPKSRANTSAKAAQEASRLNAELRRNGVKDLNVQTVVLAGSGDRSLTTITFPALVAKAPSRCGTIPGYDTPTGVPMRGEGVPHYELGCTVETMMAKQIARPGDLLGRPGFETNADGRRQNAVAAERGYYGNKANPPLEGETSSEVQ